jgi:hypothetical protein
VKEIFRINISYKTEDIKERELCDMYWKRDERGYWINSVEDISKSWNINVHSVSEYVRKYCTAFIEGFPNCQNCGEPVFVLLSRANIPSKRTRDLQENICDKCKTALARENEENAKQQKRLLMKQAFENKEYDNINEEGIYFLYDLFITNNLRELCNKLNVSIYELGGDMKTFNDIHLIDYNYGYDFYVLPELKELILKAKPYVDEYQKQRKEELMLKAIEGEIYKSLNTLELNYLIALAFTLDLNKASKMLGLGYKDANNIYYKLHNLNLININTEPKYLFIESFAEKLKQNGFTKKTKSIFGSPKALELFRELKNYFLFVYPEIPCCAFTNKNLIEYIFTEQWHYDYYLKCRVDFLVCDNEGNPLCAFEYQGGYHNSENQVTKDEFKKQILLESGIPIYYVNKETIFNFSQLNINLLAKGKIINEENVFKPINENEIEKD